MIIKENKKHKKNFMKLRMTIIVLNNQQLETINNENKLIYRVMYFRILKILMQYLNHPKINN